MLNNFKECWWDHLIVDTLGCNLLGIVVGFYIIDLFKLERYRWSLRDAPLQTSTWNQIKHFFTHWDLSQLEVKSFSSVKKYLQLLWYFTFVYYSLIYRFKLMTWMCSFWSISIRFLPTTISLSQELLLLDCYVWMLLNSTIGFWFRERGSWKSTVLWLIWSFWLSFFLFISMGRVSSLMLILLGRAFFCWLGLLGLC